MSERKRAIVTGASRGIGRAIAYTLAEDGYEIVVNYQSNEEAAKETLAGIEAKGGTGRLARFDVANQEETVEAINELLQKMGGVELLVNNAGITADGLFAMMSYEKWQRVIQTSLDGFYNVTKPVLKPMLRAKAGNIITVSSVSGLIGNRGQANYSAAKAGVIAASKALSSEVARLGIRVNVVAPGLIETDMAKDAPKEFIKQMIPMGRLGRAEEVASVVRFLATDAASYITGAVIPITGGMA